MNDFFDLSAPESEHGMPAHQSSGSVKRILLVDDDFAMRQILMDLLMEDYQVLTAGSGAEAIELVDSQKIDLVLLDLNLPANDGLEALNQLILNHPLLPVVLITARPNQFLPAVALGVGALLEKPLDFVELFRSIRHLLEESDDLKLSRMTLQPGMFHYVPQKTNLER